MAEYLKATIRGKEKHGGNIAVSSKEDPKWREKMSEKSDQQVDLKNEQEL